VQVPAAAARISDALREAGDPARAEQEQLYLKSHLQHHGASVPAIRKIVRQALAAEPGITHDELVRLVEALWERPVHECRMAAVELLDAGSGLLVAADLALIERLLRESRTWALVDGLAANVAGPLVARHPELTTTLDRWAVDDDFWIRRSALLALLLGLRRGAGDFDRFCAYAEPMLGEREFFVRKAIGWVLREASKQQPDRVYAWLEPRASQASGVTVREAVKYLAPAQRDAVLAAYRAGRSPGAA
jgi:3-methyladenine DNA glycosylase AlkD